MHIPIRRSTFDSTTVRFHDSAASLLASCQSAFKTRERDANIIYPFALKAKYTEAQQPSRPKPVRRASVRVYSTTATLNSDTDTDDEGHALTKAVPSQFWLSLWSNKGRQSSLDMVLSCTKGPIGDYPIFLYSNVGDECLTFDFIKPRIDQLVSRLRLCVSPRRVFSVFGPAPLTKAFVSSWSSVTLAKPIIDPYYAATHTYCTRETLSKDELSPLPTGHELRLAQMSDLWRVAQLCHGFAAGSEPFVLSHEEAILEARNYIQAGQVFVYNITSVDGHQETSSIVCVTRTSGSVSAITKVYTNPDHRGKRCAERLVRHVCEHLLYEAQKNSVVLFVAHDNKAAEKVYHRVGFGGLWNTPRPEGVSDWLEIGFEDTDLGHW